MPQGITERQQREREFFEEYWSRCDVNAPVNFDPIAGRERRPWNPYWYVFEAAQKQRDAGARRLLDFGCGVGIDSIRFAILGFDVSGFDITPRCVEAAKQLAATYHLSESTHFSVQASESLTYPNESFDVVVGVDILHHVDVSASVAECMRVLKRGGVAVFKEWVDVALFDRIRNTALVSLFFPKERNLDAYITEDERKLNAQDLAIIRNLCPTMTERRFYIFARLDRLLRSQNERSASFMERVDWWLCSKIPSLSKLGGSVVLELHRQ
jgi:2-polyprenyl-3-methyl-5-hydroxy-6-metoxy-1,4-benzoquinol methylase